MHSPKRVGSEGGPCVGWQLSYRSAACAGLCHCLPGPFSAQPVPLAECMVTGSVRDTSPLPCCPRGFGTFAQTFRVWLPGACQRPGKELRGGQRSEFSQTQTGSPGALLPRAGRVPGSRGPVAAVRSSTHASLPSSRTPSAQPRSGAQTALVAGCADFSEPPAVRPAGHKCVPAVTEAALLGSQSLPKPKAQRTGGGRRSAPAAACGPLRAREPPTGGKGEAG